VPNSSGSGASPTISFGAKQALASVTWSKAEARPLRAAARYNKLCGSARVILAKVEQIGSTCEQKTQGS
jgi:hypothetical protein